MNNAALGIPDVVNSLPGSGFQRDKTEVKFMVALFTLPTPLCVYTTLDTQEGFFAHHQLTHLIGDV